VTRRFGILALACAFGIAAAASGWAGPLSFNPTPKGGIKGALLPAQLHLWRYDKSAGHYVVAPGSASRPYVPHMRKASKTWTIGPGDVLINNIAYFLRRRRDQFNVFLHVVVPILGIVAFTPAWLAAAGLPVFSFITTLSPPLSYAGPAVAIWMGLGILYLIWLLVRHPARVAEVSRVHLDEPGEQAKPASPVEVTPA